VSSEWWPVRAHKQQPPTSLQKTVASGDQMPRRPRDGASSSPGDRACLHQPTAPVLDLPTGFLAWTVNPGTSFARSSTKCLKEQSSFYPSLYVIWEAACHVKATAATVTTHTSTSIAALVDRCMVGDHSSGDPCKAITALAAWFVEGERSSGSRTPRPEGPCLCWSYSLFMPWMDNARYQSTCTRIRFLIWLHFGSD